MSRRTNTKLENAKGEYGLVCLGSPPDSDNSRLSYGDTFRPPNGTNDVTVSVEEPHVQSAGTDRKMFDADFVLYPMTTSFRIVGCMHYGMKRERGKLPTPSLTFIYSIIVLIIVWLNAFRFLFVFKRNETFGGELFSKLVNLTWFGQCALNQLACFVSSHNKNRLPKFFDAWMTIKRTDSEWPTRRSVVRRKAVAFAIISWICVAVNVSYLACGFFNSNVFDVWFLPLKSDEAHISVRILCIALGLLLSGTWVFPLVLTYSSGAIILRDFTRFNEELHEAIDSSGRLNGSLKYFRQKHQKICRLAGISDNCIYFLNAITVTANIIIICLGLYGLAFHAEQFAHSALVLTDVIYKISFSIVMMFILLYGGAMVHTKAHQPLNYLYNIDMHTLSEEDKFEMNIFLHKLNGPPIGLTVGTLFTIDKLTILTILGILTTYFVLLVEFRPSFEEATMCNLTASITNGTISVLSS